MLGRTYQSSAASSHVHPAASGHHHVGLGRALHDQRIELRVENGAGPAPSTAPATEAGHGHGLLGMTERAASVGGSVRSGPTEDGGYAVRATLPVSPMVGTSR